MSRHETDVLVVGAGIAGLATARMLRDRHGLDPLLVDRSESPPAEATARTAWMIRTDAHDEAIAPIVRRSAELWRSGTCGEFLPHGGFLIGPGSADLAERIPAMSGRGDWRPQDGFVEASSVLAALRPPPSRLLAGVRVERVERAGASLAVTTSRGTIRARVVVNAAGAWAGELGSIPVTPLKRHVAITDCRRVPEGSPFAWDVAAGFYVRPHEAGALICACDERPSAPGDARVEDGAVEEILALASRLQPGLGPQRVVGAWTGQRSFSPDRRLIAGWDGRIPCLFHVAALGGHGITIAPGLGELAAGAIAAGPGTPPCQLLEPFSPGRFA